MADQDRVRWTKLVADFESSDLTQREFATERGVSFYNLRYWIYRLRQESRPLKREATVYSGQGPERAVVAEGSRLVPVRVVASAPKARHESGGEGLLELALPSGARLRFPTGTDLGYLQALAAAL
jgi:transposase